MTDRRPWWRKVRGAPAEAGPAPDPLSPAAVWLVRGAVVLSVVVVALLVVATASLLPIFVLVVPLIAVARLPRIHRQQVFSGGTAPDAAGSSARESLDG